MNANMNNAPKAKSAVAANETWGGDHVRLVVREGGAEIEFDCAHGEITKPWETDSEGNFDLPGNFVSEIGGPTRSNQGPGRASRYIGRVQGSTMTLTVKFTDNNETVDTFSLARGNQGRLRKCKS